MPQRLARAALAQLLLGSSLLAAVGCGDGAGVDVPALQIVTSTTGPEPDPDGYTVRVDSGAAQAIGTDDTLTVDPLSNGDHSVLLEGLAPNCVAEGSDPRTVGIAAGATARVAFAIACGATAGSVEITVATSGVQPDADGYTVTVEGTAPQPIGSNASLVLTGVGVGERSVRLDGIEPNCAVGGDNPLSVTVAGGDTASVTFTVTCNATTGSVLVRTATTGNAPDADGYLVSIDGGATRGVGVDDSLAFAALAPGNHAVLLEGLASNCRINGINPVTVAVVPAQQARAEFAIVCPIPRVSKWTPMNSGTSLTLVDVWGSSGTSVYAVGQAEDTFEGAILHYDGTAWQNQFDEGDVAIEAIWGSGPDNVYAVGSTFSDGPATGLVLRSTDGRTWSSVPGPQFEDGVEVFFRAVWGSGPTDIFLAGTTDQGFGQTSGFIARFDGAAWALQTVPESDFLLLTDLWGTAPNDMFAVGNVSSPDDEFETAHIMHYDGTQWSVVDSHDSAHLEAIWGNGPRDVFAVGFDGLILRYDGGTWRPVPSSGGEFLFDVWSGSPTDIFPVGETGTILRSSGSRPTWTRERPTSATLFGIWGASTSDVFAVGFGGTILHGTP